MATKCPRCGELNADNLTICGNCKAVLIGFVRDHNESSAVSRTSSPGDEDSRCPKGAVDEERKSARGDWKSRLLPVLAVVALLAILIGNLLQESALAKMSDADTLQEVIDASEDARVDARVIQVGIIMLALVVAGISIEYRQQ